MNSKIVLHVLLLGLAALVAPMARAGIFNVNTTADLPDDGFGISTCHTSAGTCSLRAAIMKANQIGGSNIIYVPAGTYTLAIPPSGSNGDDTGDLNITTSIAIVGQGAGRTIVDANHIDRVLDVAPGQFAGLTDVTIRNGLTSYGGGIFNAGVLTITHSVIEGSSAFIGGGFYVSTSGVLTVVGSTIRANVASALGGGIYLDGSATVRESTLYGNQADSGGGIHVSNFGQFLYAVNSTISGNYANADGGGITSDSSTFLYNVSIIGNDADHDHDQNGGIGGGVYNTPGSSVVLFNTLIAGNTSAVYNDDDCNGALEVYGWNLFGELSGCSFTGNGNFARGLVSRSTIGPLQDNGGPTLTHALLPGSEAIDATNNQGCIDKTNASLLTDQRGAPRGLGLACDVGAFEYVDRIFQDGFN